VIDCGECGKQTFPTAILK